MLNIKSAALAALFVCIVALAWILFKSQTMIEVKVNEHTCFLKQNNFALQWQHSVEKTRWTEFYTLDDQHLLLSYTDLVSFGAGTPSDYPIVFQKNGVVRMKVNRKIDELSWFISSRMQGVLITKKHRWMLHEDFPNYSLVQIRVLKQPLWKTWQIGACP